MNSFHVGNLIYIFITYPYEKLQYIFDGTLLNFLNAYGMMKQQRWLIPQETEIKEQTPNWCLPISVRRDYAIIWKEDVNCRSDRAVEMVSNDAKETGGQVWQPSSRVKERGEHFCFIIPLEVLADAVHPQWRPMSTPRKSLYIHEGLETSREQFLRSGVSCMASAALRREQSHGSEGPNWLARGLNRRPCTPQLRRVAAMPLYIYLLPSQGQTRPVWWQRTLTAKFYTFGTAMFLLRMLYCSLFCKVAGNCCWVTLAGAWLTVRSRNTPPWYFSCCWRRERNASFLMKVASPMFFMTKKDAVCKQSIRASSQPKSYLEELDSVHALAIFNLLLAYFLLLLQKTRTKSSKKRPCSIDSIK